MGSRGAVIPFFLERQKTGILPITDERMTRFNITLQHGVDFVLQCLKKMWGGELFVPKIPSYRITDLAEAINPDCRREIVGIRSDEKLHEEMITETDALQTIEFGDYDVILPSARPKWKTDEFTQSSNDRPGNRVPEGFCYNSGTNRHFLSVEELKQLITSELLQI